MQGTEDRPIEVFYSYSHEDEDYRKKLGKHLSVLRRAGLIADWHDRDINAGIAWQEEIDRHLLSADIVLLLVSASFIASDYCWGDEMSNALARHKEKKARVVPIILHPCGWLMTPLNELQCVPRDNKAISLWPNEHAAFDDVLTEIAKVVDDLRRGRTAEPELVEQASAVAVVASTPSPPRPDPLTRAGEGDDADALPPGEGDDADAAGAPLPQAGEGGTRDSGRVRAKEKPVPKDGVYIAVDPRELPDFAVFRDADAPWCPEMAVIPAGRFLMGSSPDEPERSEDEGPQHWVTVGHRFAIGRYTVTFAEYDHFCQTTRREMPKDQGWGRGWQPVINVSWWDAKAYVEWLSRDIGQLYRLPSEGEWEYACRAGTTTPFSFGETVTPRQANYDGNYTYAGGAEGVYREQSVAVGSLPANPWGLHEMHGNVWEWLEDVWHDNYSGAPTDGSAWTECEGINSDGSRVARGGSWDSNPWLCRSAFRIRYEPGYRNYILGFRVARTLDQLA